MSRNFISSLFFTSLFLMMFSSRCYAMDEVEASRCVLVDLDGKNGHQLTPLLDEFSERMSLEPNKSHPINPRYLYLLNEDAVAEISYVIGMGKFGAMLAFFSYDDDKSDKLVSEFDEFVSHLKESQFKISMCSEHPDFKIPTIRK